MAAMMTVGAVAAATGVRSSTVRYYDELGLLPRAPRTRAGYRAFPSQTIRRIGVIRAAQQLGFRLGDLARFFRTRESGGRPCDEVRRAGEQLLAGLDAEIDALRKKRTRVRRTLTAWDRLLATTPVTKPAYLLETLRDA